MLIKNNMLVDLVNTSSFTNRNIETIFLNSELTEVIRKNLLKKSHYIPETQEALIRVKDLLISDPIGYCEKSLLNTIVKNEIISRADKLKILLKNDRSLSKADLYALLVIIEPNLNNLKNTKEVQKINTGDLDNDILNFLESKQLFKVARFQKITRLTKLFNNKNRSIVFYRLSYF